MDRLRIEPFFHADTGTWTYVVHRGGDAVVIDPVLDYDPKSGRIGTDSVRAVQDYLASNGLKVHRILETHAHADHLTSAQVLRAATGAPVGIGHGIRGVQAHFAGVFAMEAGDPALRDAFDATFHDGDAIAAGALSATTALGVVDSGSSSCGMEVVVAARPGSEAAARRAARRRRVPRRTRVAEWPWGRAAVVTRSSRIKTSRDYARDGPVKSSKNVS